MAYAKFTYDDVKAHYESIKPIRGRAVEIRPCGTRRKDWQQIVKHEDGSYSYRLFQTDCVTYKPDDTIVIAANNWHTPSTSEFITAWSPFYCYKKYNVLWVNTYGTKVPLDKPLTIKVMRDKPDMFTNPYEPEYRRYHIHSINRMRAKEARSAFDPFLSWMKTFLSLSDGWVAFDTAHFARAGLDIIKFERYGRSSVVNVSLFAQPNTEDDLYLKLFIELIESATNACYEYRNATSKDPRVQWARDRRYKYETLRKALYQHHATQTPEIFDAVPVMPDDRERANVITN